MQSKTNSLHIKGFSIIELTVSLFILVTISSIAFMYLYPAAQKRRARDVKRVADLRSLSRAIEEYRINTGSYPDSDNTTRTSNVLPTGNGGPYESVTQGWIDSSFSSYIQKIPVDPKNTGIYVYTYRKSGSNYELNAVLEATEISMTSDGGNSNSKYEVGTSLTLMN